MKHFMLPRSPMLREAHPSSKLLASPNPSAQKQRSNRKQRGFSKEYSDPNVVPLDAYNSVSPFAAAKPSMPLALTAKMRTPLPSRPPPPSGIPGAEYLLQIVREGIPQVLLDSIASIPASQVAAHILDQLYKKLHEVCLVQGGEEFLMIHSRR